MATGDDDISGRREYAATVIKVVVATLFVVLVPVGVARNAFNLGDKLSVLPGITKGGGMVSGVVAAIYVLGVVGVLTGGVILATGADVPLLDGDTGPPEFNPATTSTPTLTPTATATPPTTSTITPTPTPTATPTAAEQRQRQLGGFQSDYLERLEYTMENDTLTGVPVLGSAYRETDDGTLELWVVFWECDFADAQTTQWLYMGDQFPSTAGTHDGAHPDRLRMYGVTNLTHWQDEIASIRTEDAALAYNRTRDPSDYTRNWWERRHEPSQAENETAYEIVVEDSGQEVADRAFYNDHAEDDLASCNGGATIGEGNDGGRDNGDE